MTCVLSGKHCAGIAMRWHRHALAAHPDCRDPDHPGCAKCLGDDCEVEAEDLDCADDMPAIKRVANVCWPILLACAFFAVMAGAAYLALLLAGVSVALGGYAATFKKH